MIFCWIAVVALPLPNIAFLKSIGLAGKIPSGNPSMDGSIRAASSQRSCIFIGEKQPECCNKNVGIELAAELSEDIVDVIIQ